MALAIPRGVNFRAGPTAANLPRVLLEDAHVALVFKPAGVGLARSKARAGPPLTEWLGGGGVSLSAEPDALAAPAPVSSLRSACAGVVAVAKTARAQVRAQRHALASRGEHLSHRDRFKLLQPFSSS